MKWLRNWQEKRFAAFEKIITDEGYFIRLKSPSPGGFFKWECEIAKDENFRSEYMSDISNSKLQALKEAWSRKTILLKPTK